MGDLGGRYTPPAREFVMIDVQHFQHDADNILVVNLSGELTKAQYRVAFPHLESELGSYQKLRLLFDVRKLEGWEANTCWKNLSFNSRHRTDLQKIAVLGEQRWKAWLSRACGPLSCSQLRQFSSPEEDEAFAWIGA